MRKAYLAQPDSEPEADDWTNPEEWKWRKASVEIKRTLGRALAWDELLDAD